jgi:hypothetical protein
MGRKQKKSEFFFSQFFVFLNKQKNENASKQEKPKCKWEREKENSKVISKTGAIKLLLPHFTIFL